MRCAWVNRDRPGFRFPEKFPSSRKFPASSLDNMPLNLCKQGCITLATCLQQRDHRGSLAEQQMDFSRISAHTLLERNVMVNDQPALPVEPRNDAGCLVVSAQDSARRQVAAQGQNLDCGCVPAGFFLFSRALLFCSCQHALVFPAGRQSRETGPVGCGYDSYQCHVGEACTRWPTGIPSICLCFRRCSISIRGCF